MTTYGVLRLFHGDWRWIILALEAAILARSIRGGAWKPLDERLWIAFVAAVDLQLLLGVILYFVSPFFAALHASAKAAMHQPTTRFFAVEHETAMLLGVVVAHIGRAKLRRATDDARKHRIALTTAIVFALVVAWATPWPGRAVGRPLFRTNV
jgi:hypothetical protein